MHQDTKPDFSGLVKLVTAWLHFAIDRCTMKGIGCIIHRKDIMKVLHETLTRKFFDGQLK